MSEHNPSVEWYGRTIYLNERYLLYFSDQKREMTDKELKQYRDMKALPERLMWKEILQADPTLNPNVKPLTGRQLIDAANATNFIPQFDQYFDTPGKETRRLMLVPAEGMEFFIQQRMAEKRGAR